MSQFPNYNLGIPDATAGAIQSHSQFAGSLPTDYGAGGGWLQKLMGFAGTAAGSTLIGGGLNILTTGITGILNAQQQKKNRRQAWKMYRQQREDWKKAQDVEQERYDDSVEFRDRQAGIGEANAVYDKQMRREGENKGELANLLNNVTKIANEDQNFRMYNKQLYGV